MAKTMKQAMRDLGLVGIEADEDTDGGLVGAVEGEWASKPERAREIAAELEAAGYQTSVAVDRNAPEVWVYVVANEVCDCMCFAPLSGDLAVANAIRSRRS